MARPLTLRFQRGVVDSHEIEAAVAAAAGSMKRDSASVSVTATTTVSNSKRLSQAECIAELTAFYQQHKPEKVRTIPAILKHYLVNESSDERAQSFPLILEHLFF